MSRWEPNASERLRQAAMELYGERGYEQTTVAEIAKRAGLTERTFFRYFADKREVLFAGSSTLQDFFVSTLAGVPDSATPIEAVGEILDAAAGWFQDRPLSRQRQAIIDANAELQERELIKLARLSTALADAFRQRGLPDPAASLAAEAAVAVFKVAWERWMDETDKRDLAELMRESLDELKAVTS